MRHEERAARAVPSTYRELEHQELVAQVAGAIREAVAVERDACGRLAAVMGMQRQGSSDAEAFTSEQESEARMAARIVTAIMARSNES